MIYNCRKTARSLLTVLLPLAVVTSVATAGPSRDWKIYSFREPAFLDFNGNSFTPRRGLALSAGYLLKAGNEGGFSIDGEGGARLSLIGPGLLRLSDDASQTPRSQIYSLDYGDLYLKIPAGQTLRLRFGNYELQVEDAEFFVEQSIEGHSLKLRNVGPRLQLDPITIVEPGQSLFVESSRVDPIRLSRANVLADIDRLQNRHNNNRHRYDLSQKSIVRAEPVEFRNLFAEGFVNLGTIRLGPKTAGSTYVQNMPHVGPSGRFIYAHTFKLPDNPTRLDYLYRPNFRLGAITFVVANTLQPAAGLASKTLLPGAGALVGLGALGFAFDFETGVQTALNLSSHSRYALTSPLYFAGSLSYRFDLQTLTEMDLGLTVGLRYGRYAAAVANLSAAESTVINPKSFHVGTWATFFGLSFMF